MKPTIIATAAALTAVLGLTGCGVEPGRVTSRWINCVGKPIVCTPWMKTKTPDGHTTAGPIKWSTYRHCKTGETYPDCTRT
jgi:hypothetical protein